MSVLFDALSKAARDYRAQKTPLIVPTIKPSPSVRLTGHYIVLAVLAGIILGGGIYLLNDTDASARSPLPDLQVEADLPELKESPQITVSEVLKPDFETSDGIALPEEMLTEVMDQIDGSFVPKAQNKGDVPQKSVLVTEGAGDLFSMQAEADRAIVRKDWGEAIRQFEQIMALYPDNSFAFEGALFARTNRAQQIDIDKVKGYIADRPHNGSLYASLARMLGKRGEKADALRAWGRAFQLEPSNKEFGLALAIMYDREGRDREALSIYKTIPKPLPPQAKRRYDYLRSKLTGGED